MIHIDESGNPTTISPCKGKNRSDEVRSKISQSHKGKSKSEEHRKKIGLSGTGKIHINNGEKNTTVFKSELDDYLKNGWQIGMKKRK